MEKYGIALQVKLLDQTSKSCKNSPLLQGLLFDVCKKVLSPTAQGDNYTSYNTFEFKSCGLNGTKEVERIRKKALIALFRAYNSNKKIETKKVIIETVNAATATPTRGNYSDNLLEVILSNSIYVLSFYSKILPNESFEIIERIEETAFNLHRRSFDQTDDTSALFCKHKEIINLSNKIKKTLNLNPKYVTFKCLVGFSINFTHAWESLGYSEYNQYRHTHLKSLINSLDDENFEDWKELFIYCANLK